jgi:hypothetical protein
MLMSAGTQTASISSIKPKALSKASPSVIVPLNAKLNQCHPTHQLATHSKSYINSNSNLT